MSDQCIPRGVVRNAVPADGPIIVFDAMCVLCSASAQAILTRDRSRRFRLASMQNAVGTDLYRQHGIDPENPETMIVVENGAVFRDSDAILRIYAGLGWPWRAIAVFRFVPRFVRDPAYRWVARNRYRLFGRRETCWLPSDDDADRIL